MDAMKYNVGRGLEMGAMHERSLYFETGIVPLWEKAT